MSNITLNSAIANAITETVSLSGKADRKLGSTIDLMVSEKMVSTDFVSPKSKTKTSTASPEMFEQINAAIVAGFTKAAQQLLAKPTKSLEEADKAEKRYWQQQIGAKRNDFETGLAKRELAKRGGADASRTPRQPKSPVEKLRAALETVEKVVQGHDAWDFDAADFQTALRSLNRLVK